MLYVYLWFYFSYVALKAVYSIQPQHKPQFERPKSSTQRYLPVSEIRCYILMLMLEIDRIHVEGIDQVRAISDPQSRAIKVN